MRPFARRGARSRSPRLLSVGAGPPSPPARRTMGTSGRYEVLTEQVRGDGREPLKLELEAFLDAVRNGAQPLVSGREGAAALELAYAIINAIGTHSHHHG